MIETYSNNKSDEINLIELIQVLFEGKWKIITLTGLISIIGVIYSLSLPNIYESKAMLAPADSSSGISGALGSYSGLAGLAGLNVPSVGAESNTSKAILKLSSLSFFENNILPNIFLPDLLALKSWNSQANILVYDDSLYDIKSNSWVVDKNNPNSGKPSSQKGFRAFTGNHFSISEDKKTGFISLIVKHQSPYIAKEWTEIAINQINTFYRQKDKLESEKAVKYLNQQIASTNLSEVKEAVAELLKEETKKLALIEAKQLYVFEYIDPPAVMEIKSEPDRASICILIALVGGLLSIFLVLLEHYFFKKKHIDFK